MPTSEMLDELTLSFFFFRTYCSGKHYIPLVDQHTLFLGFHGEKSHEREEKSSGCIARSLAGKEIAYPLVSCLYGTGLEYIVLAFRAKVVSDPVRFRNSAFFSGPFNQFHN